MAKAMPLQSTIYETRSKERVLRRKPQILTFEEEERLLKCAEPHIRMLTILIIETGLRLNKEALSLRWAQVDFANGVIEITRSKTEAGERLYPGSHSNSKGET
jgi:integrase